MEKFITCKHKSKKDKKGEQKQMEAIKEYRKKKINPQCFFSICSVAGLLLRCIHFSSRI